MQIHYKLLYEDSIKPNYAYAGDGGLDLYAHSFGLLNEHNRSQLFGTGVAIAIPENYVGLVCPRSGLAAKYGVTIVNAPGVIDSGYRGEIMVLLTNTSHTAFAVTVGMKIAQLVIVPVCFAELTAVTDFPQTKRSLNGFGSSGM